VSNLGQAALIVVGTVVGYYLGYPQLGFALGSLAGAALFPTQLPAGPRIQDTRTTTATVGGPVPIIFGTCSVAGTVIWLAPYVEHSSGGGKGGPQQQTFNYTQSIAIGLAERVDPEAPDDVGAIAGISRIWENGAIVYDIRPQLAASSDLNSLAETDQAYANRLIASAAYAETFTLYLGDELQLPDPTIEAIQGVGQVPAFRGLAYIVYPNRALTIAQGLRHPNFQFEVYQAGIGECTEATIYSNEVLYPWASGIGDPVNTQNVNTFVINDFDNSLPAHATYNFSATYTDENDVTAILGEFYGVPFRSFVGYAVGWDNVEVDLEISTTGGPTVAQPPLTPDPTILNLFYQYTVPRDGYFDYSHRPTPNPSQSGLYYTPGNTWWEPNRIVYVTAQGAEAGEPALIPPFTAQNDWDPGFWYQYVVGANVVVTRSPSAPVAQCSGLPVSAQAPGYAVRPDGTLVKCNPWVRDTSTTYKVLQQFVASDETKAQYPLNPCLPLGDPKYNDAAFWTAAYNAAVTAGMMAPGLVYGTDYPLAQAFAWITDQRLCQGLGSNVSLCTIIAAVCKRAGLTAVDCSDLAEVTVDGYPIASLCSGSAIITPLRSVGFFDVVESTGTLKFVTRGKPIVATLTTDDIGAYDAATNPSQCPPSVTTARSQDEDLPRSIRLHYMATMRDYQDGEQDSKFRLNSAATNDVDVTLPICLSDVQAARCAEVLWANAWAGRTAHELSVDQAWLGLDPADCIGVPVDGVIRRLRIDHDATASGVLRKLSCVRDDDGAYISFAVASAPQSQPQTLTFIGPTSYELLDLPCLRDADNDPGFYVAAQRSSDIGNGWKGCVIYKSTDGGATFTSQFSLLVESTIGHLGGAVPASPALTWDVETVIDVTVASSLSTFESCTDDAVLAGANAAAMGADGRWEIVQFATATQIDATHWQLSRLLRGRRGTEHVMGSSRAGDTFVLLSLTTLKRLVLNQSEIGTPRVYKAVSIGASYSSGIDQTFAGHAQALVCFSPVTLGADRLTDGDIRIHWFRRSRLGRTLMSGVDIPLGEATEAFSVDILDPASPASPPVVLRTLATTTTQAIYTSAEQLADFGSSPPTTLKVAVYQLSAIVGRGTPAIALLEIPT
jgi:hypothetical protein